MNKRKKSKNKPPSRQRYEIKNPTVSARMSIGNRDKLRLVLQKQGTTLAKVLIAFANEQELKLKPLEEARKNGYEEAKRLYMVTYPCDVCGKRIVITDFEAKEAVGHYMHNDGWGHAACHNKTQQS